MRKKTSKFSIMLIGTLAIGMFLLPGVVSTFSGSHDYIAPENVDCMMCHPEILVELSASVDDHTHANSAWTEKQTLDCLECHTVSGIGDNPAIGHAAQKVDCAFCHDSNSFSGVEYAEWEHALASEYGMNCDSCHRSGDGSMFLDDVYENIINLDAAHFGFYNSSLDSDLLLGGSESCIGCHTHVDFNMTSLPTSGMTYNPVTGEFGKE